MHVNSIGTALDINAAIQYIELGVNGCFAEICLAALENAHQNNNINAD